MPLRSQVLVASCVVIFVVVPFHAGVYLVLHVLYELAEVLRVFDPLQVVSLGQARGSALALVLLLDALSLAVQMLRVGGKLASAALGRCLPGGEQGTVAAP